MDTGKVEVKGHSAFGGGRILNSMKSKIVWNKLFITSKCLTDAGKVTNKLATKTSFKMAERSEAKSAKRSFAS